jgi:hypothetical protein
MQNLISSSFDKGFHKKYGEQRMTESLTFSKLKNRGNKTKIIGVFVLVALLAVSFIAVLPLAGAHNPALTIPTWSYLNVFPGPVGINQRLNIFGWLDIVPPTANGEYGDRWSNLTVTVNLPDGTTTTLGPFVSDPVGTIFQSYTPTQVGTYKFQFNFPGQTLTGINPTNGKSIFELPFSPFALSNTAYVGDHYTPSQSSVVSVTVQSTPIAPAPAYPLPTEYWTTPVSQAGHVQNWEYITADWLASGSIVNDLTSPPQSAHIDWTKPINFGGVAGLPNGPSHGNDGYYSYLSYEGMFNPPVIMNGQLYYNIANPPEYGFVDVDLHTGQQVWYQNASSDPLASSQLGFAFLKQSYPQLSYGQELDYESPNQAGVIDYLWSTYTAANGSSVWSMYDPFTGNWIMDLVNIPGGAAFFGASNMIIDAAGSFVTFNPSADFKTMSVWNSTYAIQNTYPSNNLVLASNGYWMWRPPLGQVIDASNATIDYPITGNIPAAFQAVNAGFFGSSNAISLSLLGIDQSAQLAIYCNATASLGEANYPTDNAFALLGISIHPGTVGQVQFAKIDQMPANNITLEPGFMGDGIFTLFQKETRLYMGFSETDGSQIWTTTTSEVDNHMYGVSGGVYQGVLFSSDSIGNGGHIYAYDIKTGALLWDDASPSMGNSGYWANIPTSIAAFVNGNIFWYGTEHSPSAVLEPGFMIGALNAKTGEQIWNITFWDGGGGIGTNTMAIADGYAVALNIYDHQIYAFSKGPTATTAETPLSAITQGQSLVVQGTVDDIAPGTKQPGIAARFPNGVAAVSEASQRAWMEYVYMQNPKPATVTGVPVSITVIDPNNNYHSGGIATSDISGTYSLRITPDMTPVPGKYTVIATFTGSNSYYPSYAESTFVVDPAPTTTTSPTQSSTVDTYFIPAVIAIIIVVIIIGVLIMLMMRKRQ